MTVTRINKPVITPSPAGRAASAAGEGWGGGSDMAHHSNALKK